MKNSTLFFTTLFFAIPSFSQHWSIYLGKNADSAFTTGYTYPKKNWEMSWREFSDYSFQHQQESRQVVEKTNRDGVILDAKSTTTYLVEGKIITAQGKDSIISNYSAETDYTRHGRSAALSVYNLFSKKEDRFKQDAPTVRVSYHRINGVIYHENDSSLFSIKGLQWGTDSLRFEAPKELVKHKNGKIKKATGNEGLLLMRGPVCVAAIDFTTEPQEYFLSRQLSDQQKLIIVAFLQARELIMVGK